MTLFIKNIQFRNFRSYEELELALSRPTTVLVGPNAVGKTNIIEGIQLLTALVTFRHATTRELIRKGEANAHLKLHAADEVRELEMALFLEDRTRRHTLNGKAKRTSDIKGIIPSVTFTPDDLTFVKGSPSVRRRALDVLGSQLSANYHAVAKDYEKVVRHKNRLLKDEAPKDMLESINEMVITVGAQLCAYRSALFQKLRPQLEDTYASIAHNAEVLKAEYVPSWLVGRDTSCNLASPSRDTSDDVVQAIARDVSLCDSDCIDDVVNGIDVADISSTPTITRDEAREEIRRHLEACFGEERARKRILTGPGLDVIHFTIDDFAAEQFASQGQQRSIVLAYKLAEAHVIEEMLGKRPVLLLDDVMSELDETRRRALVDYIESNVQTFITTANLDYFDANMLESAEVIKLPL